ncbi:hypothetical protein EVAR_19339_1 [Eumeta japonica]|uniref:Uncharacterized protein n=1 Tax=Eumeta variegata TaxID=151549 RepID=A0A4C1TRD4_EUMVA|nr:hypothetical protein EVAR_19339_1 [Eumeta japonica]
MTLVFLESISAVAELIPNKPRGMLLKRHIKSGLKLAEASASLACLVKLPASILTTSELTNAFLTQVKLLASCFGEQFKRSSMLSRHCNPHPALDFCGVLRVQPSPPEIILWERMCSRSEITKN